MGFDQINRLPLVCANQKPPDAGMNYEPMGMVAEHRRIGVTPSVAQSIKLPSGLSQFKLRGAQKGGDLFGLNVIANNLFRLGKLLGPPMGAA